MHFKHFLRYACEVCSHVSRSKDALRKHVSYRHPGAPSPCETEAKRKRTKAAAAARLQHDLSLLPSTSQYAHQMTLQQQLQSGQCYSSDPPSYPGQQPMPAHHQATTMDHALDSVKSEPSTPNNSTGSQTPSQRDPSTILNPPTISGSNTIEQLSGSHMTPSSATTTSTSSSLSQTQHLNQQLPQC